MGLGVYGFVRLRNPEHWDLLDDVNLAIHEAGHLFFQPLGDASTVLGGSLLQVIVPLAFIVYFLRQRDTFAASVVSAWLGASLANVALYIADARAQALPLLGGENAIHDWWYLLTEWDLLGKDLVIARWVRLAAALSFVASVVGGISRSTWSALSELSVARSTTAGPRGRAAARRTKHPGAGVKDPA